MINNFNNNKRKTNTLVIGQGVAGSLVAFMLHLHKIPFVVIDPAYPNTSSRIAAGMFSPVSGKRKAIHPMVAQQIPFAIKIYREIEHLIGATILHLHNIYQVHGTIKEQNDLHSKLTNADFAECIILNPPVLPGIKQELGAFEIIHSGWVDCELWINGFAKWLKQHDALIEAEFCYENLQVKNAGMEYQGIEFVNIIFCEGYQAINNPFFTKENIIPCKGDMLTIKYDHFHDEHIIKKNGIYLIPGGNNIFKAGSTYQWNDSSQQLLESGKKLVEQALDAMLEKDYTTIHHKTAIRPTTQNREVIAKQHPEHTGMFMLNGLGTKGILQGPWWAQHLVNFLLTG